MAGAPRLVTLAALSPALVAGVAIASRKESHQGRGQRRCTRWAWLAKARQRPNAD